MDRTLRIAVHDYSGHPFQIQLSRALAARGHHVLHLYSASFLTPRGPLERRPDDPPNLAVEGIELGEAFRKYSYLFRLRQERRYGRLLADRIDRFRPNVVLSSNTPLDAQAILQGHTRSGGSAFIFWLQDIYSVAIERMLTKRLGPVGRLLAERFTRLEARLLRNSDSVVAITPDFQPILDRWAVPAGRISVIENWAPLADIGIRPKANDWAIEHGLADRAVILYAGTLGLKHDPSLLLRLAEQMPDATVVVVSEGLGANWLHQAGASQPNLVLLPFQPFDRLSDVLGSADVLVSILEPEAGSFSVPSKVMTSLCAGRAILASIPRSNLATRIIESVDAGIVVEPGDIDAFVRAARELIADPARRARSGAAARHFAEQSFAIGPITDRFEAVILSAVSPQEIDS